MIVDLELRIKFPVGVPDEFLEFTNLPLERVKDAIDLLNDDHVELIPEPPVRLPPWGSLVKAQRTEDFTEDELFGAGRSTPVHRMSYVCIECGALVSATAIHAEWHNKLLP